MHLSQGLRGSVSYGLTEKLKEIFTHFCSKSETGQRELFYWITQESKMRDGALEKSFLEEVKRLWSRGFLSSFLHNYLHQLVGIYDLCESRFVKPD